MLQMDRTGNFTYHSCYMKWVVSQEDLQDERHISMFFAYWHWLLWLQWLLLPSAMANSGHTSSTAFKSCFQCCCSKRSTDHCCPHMSCTLYPCQPVEINNSEGCLQGGVITWRWTGWMFWALAALFSHVFNPGHVGTMWRQWIVSDPSILQNPWESRKVNINTCKWSLWLTNPFLCL